jgi:hypothetical protein
VDDAIEARVAQCHSAPTAMCHRQPPACLGRLLGFWTATSVWDLLRGVAGTVIDCMLPLIYGGCHICRCL